MFLVEGKIKLVQDALSHPVFVFRTNISNAIYDLVLYLLYEGLKILIYDGTITFDYLKKQ